MVTSNHSPRLTRSGATILGVCFGSKALRTSLYSGVNCSSCSRTSRVAQHLANGVEELPGAVRLGEIGRGARVHGLLVVAAEGERGDDDDGDLGRLGLGSNPSRRIQARQPRELDVHDDQVGLLAARRLDAGLAVVGLQETIGLTREK